VPLTIDLAAMALNTGDKLGPYEILAMIGKGGMGAVYRAHDPRTGRDVAIKVSAERFSERFDREVRAVASLNHPNICTLFDVGPNYLVMELVEGSTLAERIQEGPIPGDEALGIAKQIVEALDAAHEKSIVHRDLKPGNVMLKPDGSVKVLDFGLAKVGPRTASGSEHDAEHSPTISMAATQAGVILGTAAYMSPEQARGKTVDKRADIWAFGVVLYEMVTGKRLFQGEDLTETLASVVKERPELSGAPPQMRRLLKRCLEKDPRKRLRGIGDVWELLDEDAPAAPAGPAAPRGKNSVFPWASAAIFAIVAAVAFWAPWRASPPIDRPLVRLNLDLPGWVDGGFGRASFALSPDGTRIVYLQRGTEGGTAERGASGVPMLVTRLLEESESHILPGTENAGDPFFSPDGQWIGFYANGHLQKISIRGGAPVVLAPAPGAFGATWGNDGFIIAALNVAAPLSRIPETGGTPTEIVSLAEGGGRGLQFPQYLPGGKAILFGATGSAAGIYVKGLAAGKAQRLVNNATAGRYLPTGNSTGHIVYVDQGTLFAVPFDPTKLALRGPPQPVLNDVAGDVSFSETGNFLYRIGKAGEQVWPVDWMDSSGATRPLLATPGPYTLPSFSPDPAGRFLALTKGAGGTGEVLVYDWQNDVTVNLTRPGQQNGYPVWSPDGRHIAMFTPPNAVDWVRSDGSGEAHRILEWKSSMLPTSISPDGRYLALSERNPDTLLDLWVAPLDLSDPDQPKVGKPQVLVNAPGNDFGAVFSPDGKWIAYFSDQSGRYEVYVRPFPGPGAPRNVSVNGGAYPAWSRNGRELLFESLASSIQVVDYHVNGDAFLASRPRMWSNAGYRNVSTVRSWGLHPDGMRIAMFPPESADPKNAGGAHFGFLLNFFDELRRRAPEGK
jgi:predicted Ser/Thr protein kinase